MGGNTGTNDVWYSTDGIDWTEATANAYWADRIRYTSVVFDNRMWAIGGDDFSGGAVNDVWYADIDPVEVKVHVCKTNEINFATTGGGCASGQESL